MVNVGYKWRLHSYFVGLGYEWLIASANTPLSAHGAALQLSYRLPVKSIQEKAESSPVPIPHTPLQTPSQTTNEPFVGINIEVVSDGLKITIPWVRIVPETGDPGKDSFNQSYLQGLAQTIEDHREFWQKLEVTGHTEPRGPEVINKRLSLEYAQRFAEILTGVGTSQSKIKTFGAGSQESAAKANVNTLNNLQRRVEVHIRQTSDRQKIEDAIRNYDDQYMTPVTPGG